MRTSRWRCRTTISRSQGFRVQAGLVSSVDEETARASRAQTAATIPTIEQNYNAAVSRLGVLTGQAPGALKEAMATVAPIPKGPAAMSRSASPPIRCASAPTCAAPNAGWRRQRRRSASPRRRSTLRSTSAATSAPRRTCLGDLFKIVTGSLFAGVSQAIFNGGRLGAQVRSNEAAAEGAFALYKSTVLTALEDVENAVVALNAAKAREKQYAIAYDASNNSAIFARAQYRAGLTDFTTLNTTESSLLSARNGLEPGALRRSDRAGATLSRARRRLGQRYRARRADHAPGHPDRHANLPRTSDGRSTLSPTPTIS